MLGAIIVFAIFIFIVWAHWVGSGGKADYEEKERLYLSKDIPPNGLEDIPSLIKIIQSTPIKSYSATVTSRKYEDDIHTCRCGLGHLHIGICDYRDSSLELRNKNSIVKFYMRWDQFSSKKFLTLREWTHHILLPNGETIDVTNREGPWKKEIPILIRDHELSLEKFNKERLLAEQKREQEELDQNNRNDKLLSDLYPQP